MARKLIIFYSFILTIFALPLKAQVLNYTIPESNRSYQDGNSPLLSFRIADRSQSVGQILSQVDNSVIGTYAFSSYSDPSLSNIQLLRVTREQPAGDTYLFTSNGDRSALTYYGASSNLYIRDAVIDTSNYYWWAFAKFLTAPANTITAQLLQDASLPLNIYAVSFMPYEMWGFFANSTGLPREMYFRAFMNRVIDVVIANPSIVLSSALITPIHVNTFHYPVADAEARYQIVARFNANKSKFSANNTLQMVMALQYGDSRVTSLLAPMVVNLFSTLPFNQWGFLLPLVERFAVDPELSTTKRTSLLTTMTNTYGGYFPFARNYTLLATLKNILDAGDQVAFARADYEHLLNYAAQLMIEYYTYSPNLFTPGSTDYLIKNFSHLIPSGSQFLLNYENSLIPQRDEILNTNLASKTWSELTSILNDHYLLNTEALVRAAIGKSLAQIQSRFSERLVAVNDLHEMDFTLQAAIRLMKKKNIYNDTVWIHPLLRLYSPQQPGETTQELNARRVHIINLWTNQRAFMFDLTGGMKLGGLNVQSPYNYSFIFRDVARAYPMMMDIFYLRNYGNTTAGDGILMMNWFAQENGPIFAINAYHEGGHAIEKTFKATRPWRVLHNYWFQKDYANPSSQIVSYYSLFNEKENHAELLAAIHGGYGLYWLTTAIERFKLGDKKLLNQLIQLSLYMYDGVNGMTNLKERIRYVEILPTGESIGKPLTGNFIVGTDGTMGSFQRGWYQFYINNKKTRVWFSKHRITALLQDNILYQ